MRRVCIITRRGLIRLVTFSAAAIVALCVMLAMRISDVNTAERSLEYSYMRAIEDLSLSCDNISNTLTKGMYSSTPDMMLNMAYRLFREASIAKASLSQLPIGEVSLENTNKFLSQVGNYAVWIANKCMNGESLGDTEYQNLEKLLSFSQQLSEDLWETEQRVNAGELSYDGLLASIEVTNEEVSQTNEGFTSFEEGFESFPTLIYDGPFSDHIMERQPLMLQSKTEISESEAKEIAAHFMAVDLNSLTLSCEEEGKMPSFCFESENSFAAVTKSGGYLSYFLKYRQVNESVLTASEAINNAQNFLEKQNILDMASSYYEIKDNICTINFAYTYSGVKCYTDLVKVSVALDNGEIMGYEARGYITNHQDREFSEPAVSREEAKSILSPKLHAKDINLALIPSEGLNEVLTWEIRCVSDDNKNILVYINAQSGKEEQILILLESESGILTV